MLEIVKSAPEVSFSVVSINYGTIDVGTSTAMGASYNVFQDGASTAFANAINMSVSFKESTNASEARAEKWVTVSTALEQSRIGSIPGSECYVGSLVAATVSAHVHSKVIIPVGATTAGRVAFLLHHRMLAAIRRACEYTSTPVRVLVWRNTILRIWWTSVVQLPNTNPL